MKKIGIGIDFGTSNSVAATFDGHQVHLVELEQNLAIMPSATYISRKLQQKTGQSAIDQYIDDNTGRIVELAPEILGTASLMTGGSSPTSRNPAQTLSQTVYSEPRIDVNQKGRLFRGVKRLLGRSDVKRLMVFDQPFRLVALITPLLLRIRKTVERSTGEISSAVAGHPIGFEGKEKYRNALALSRLGEAYMLAGLENHRFFPEPIAAAVAYIHKISNPATIHIVTVDFGGGTLDFCVLRNQGRKFSVLSTNGVAIGGDHLDQRMFQTLLFPELGEGEHWARRGVDRTIVTEFPFHDYREKLLNWATTYLLHQNRYMSAIEHCAEHGNSMARKKFRRLRDLVRFNYGYRIFQSLKEAKANLSSTKYTSLDLPEIDLELIVERDEFESVVSDLLSRVDSGVHEALQRAQITPRDVDIVLRTGGSSLIPAVHQLLNRYFCGRIVQYDPFTSVAAGLAIADYYDYAPDTETADA